MDSIAIVETGISGLHLALTLQRAGVETTTYSEWTVAMLARVRTPVPAGGTHVPAAVTP